MRIAAQGGPETLNDGLPMCGPFFWRIILGKKLTLKMYHYHSWRRHVSPLQKNNQSDASAIGVSCKI